MSTNAKITTAIIAVPVIIGIVLAVRNSKNNSGATSSVMPSTSLAVSTTSPSRESTSTPSVTVGKFAYSANVQKASFSQNEQIPITLSVLNLTDAEQTMSFKNGCLGDYKIGTFDMIEHARCLPDPTSFVVPAHEVKQVKLVHYPSVYKIPAGTYTLYASFPGYGGSSVSITITS